MHPEIDKELTHATCYLPSNLAVTTDPTVSLCFLGFLCLLSPNPMYAKVVQEFSKDALCVKEYERVRE